METNNAADVPSSAVQSAKPAAWILTSDEHVHREMEAHDPDSPLDSRLSRATSELASEQEIAIEMCEQIKQDEKAGISRAANYIKLGTRLAFRVPRQPKELTPQWMTEALRFKKLLPSDATVEKVWLRATTGVLCAA